MLQNGLHSTLKVPYGTKSKYQSYSGWTKYFSEVIEAPANFSFSIKVSGNGSVSYNGDIIREATKSYIVYDGTNAKVTFSPDNGYRIKSVKVGNSDVTSDVSDNGYTVIDINTNTTLEVVFEEIPPTTYTLSIKSIGNGSASYNGIPVRGTTESFTVEEGTNATVTFSPDNGYRIKSVKVGGTDVTSSVSSNSYTISSIKANTTLEVVFEEIPPTTYTLSITATGNGSASYDGTSVRGTTKTFTVVEGTNAKVTFIPDNGYRIKSVKVGNSDVTSSVSNNVYTINNVKANTTLEVVFEEIPPTTYTLSIKATGNGSASYDGTSVRGTTKTFTVVEGTNAKVTFSPDNGYRIKSVKVGSSDVTSSVSSNSYTISSIKANTNLEVVFEEIPPTTYTLSIKATGNGSASYDGTSVRGTTKTFTVVEGTNAQITFSPDNGYRIRSVMVGDTDVTSSVSSNSYTVSSIKANTTLKVVFEEIPLAYYILSIKATGNGSASYDGTSVRGTTKTFIVVEGTNAQITFSPDNGYRIKSVNVGGTDVTSSVSSNSYTISSIKANTTLEVVFEEIPSTTYTLSIKATGNGSASYDGTSVRGTTKTFTVVEGTNAHITFSPDNGYRIKSVKVGSTDVTSSVNSNSYTISSIKANTTLEVIFEEIPPTTYTLSITATGNGSASYDGTSVRSTTKTFTVVEGTDAQISFSPDNGYRIKSVKVGSTDMTSSVSSNSYTISNIRANTTLEVVFEEIPPITYTLSIKATGSGSASYDGTTVRGTTKSFTVTEGSSAQISFSPDNGYKIKNVKVGGSDVTSSVSNNSYTISNIKDNTTLEVEFEVIPATTYTLSITATGNGSASYDGTAVRGETKSFTVVEGTNAQIIFVPDNGYRIKSVKVGSTDVTSSVSSNTYTVSNIKSDTTISVEFEEQETSPDDPNDNPNDDPNDNPNDDPNDDPNDNPSDNPSDTPTDDPSDNPSDDPSDNPSDNPSDDPKDAPTEVSFDGIDYDVESYEDRTVTLSGGSFGLVLEVPESFEAEGETWQVVGIDEQALSGNPQLAAIIWHPNANMTATVTNPNLLLYVTDGSYAPASISNVVVGDYAQRITLTDAQSGNNFYCPSAFTAERISYDHYYGMRTGFGEARGWETIALPFDVQKIAHATRGELVPYSQWEAGAGKPFWLLKLGNSGFAEADGIEANTPYAISMPNNDVYVADYRLPGYVTFSAENARVESSDQLLTVSYRDRTFTPCFQEMEANAGGYALNVQNDYSGYQGSDAEGSKFVRNLRVIHPFEAYMTSTGSTRSIGIFDDMATGILDVEPISRQAACIPTSEEAGRVKVYSLQGIQVSAGATMEEAREGLRPGVYIVNGRKMMINQE